MPRVDSRLVSVRVIRRFSVKQWSAIAVVSILALSYACDFLYLKIREARPSVGEAFGTVVMPRVLAFPLKNGRIEYDLDADNPVATVTCTNTLFPQSGYSPCWYLVHKSKQPISM